MEVGHSNRWSRLYSARRSAAPANPEPTSDASSSSQPSRASEQLLARTRSAPAPAWRRRPGHSPREGAEKAEGELGTQACSSSARPCTLKFLVPEAVLGCSSASSLVVSLRQSCRARLSVSEVADSQGFKVLSASASDDEDALRQVGRRLLERLSELAVRLPPDDGVVVEGSLRMSVLVPSAVAGAMLGPGGSAMKKLVHVTGASIKVRDAPGSTSVRCPDVTQEVVLVGGEEALQHVLDEVSKQLHLVSHEPWFPAWADLLDMPCAHASECPRTLADRRGRGVETSQYSMRLLVSKVLAGALIGKGGSFVSSMEQSCQAKIRLLEARHVFPSAPTGSRVLTAAADSEECLEKVIKQVVGRLSEISALDALDVPGEDQLKLTLTLGALVPKEAASGVIGPGGCAIKKLCESSKAFIKVHDPEANATGPDATQEISVKGDAQALEQALIEVNRVVQTQRKEPWFSAWASFSGTTARTSTAVEKPPSAPAVAYAMKYLMPPTLVAAIIGTRGSVITSMRETIRAKLHVSDSHEVFPQTQSRVLTATAEAHDSIDGVSEKVISILSEVASFSPLDCPGTSEGRLRISAIIPRHAVGGFIGAGGNAIKQLQASTETWIRVHDATESSGATRLAPDATHEVSISGPASGLVQVLQELNVHMHDCSREPWFAAWVASPLGGARESSISSVGKKLVNDTMDVLPPHVWEDPRGFSMSCVLSGRLVAPMIGHGGVHLKEVQNTTGTRIYLREMPDSDSRNMHIVGPLANVTSAYMLMMKRYLEAEAQVAGGN